MYRPRPETPLLFALALTAACAVACQPVPQPTPVPPQPPADAAAGDAGLPAEPSTCAGACAREAAMNCPIAEPSPGGVKCPDTCGQHTIKGDRWDVACMAAATSCAQCKTRK